MGHDWYFKEGNPIEMLPPFLKFAKESHVKQNKAAAGMLEIPHDQKPFIKLQNGNDLFKSF